VNIEETPICVAGVLPLYEDALQHLWTVGPEVQTVSENCVQQVLRQGKPIVLSFFSRSFFAFAHQIDSFSYDCAHEKLLPYDKL
jgi:hypothetical protein